MGVFDRLFRKSAQPASASGLNDFLSKITPNSIPAHALKVKEPALRVATAISLLVLEQSGRFTRELFTTLRESPVPVSTAILGGSNFDAAAFETAAFIHYSLLAKHLGSSDDDPDDDNDIDQDDPYVVAVRNAHHLTAQVLNPLLSFRVKEETFLNRPIVYSMQASRRRALVEVFEGILIEAIESGAPATLRPTGISLDLGVPLTVGLSARTFAVTTLPVFAGVARDIVENAAELGFE